MIVVIERRQVIEINVPKAVDDPEKLKTYAISYVHEVASEQDWESDECGYAVYIDGERI
jgi:hypothetical protein